MNGYPNWETWNVNLWLDNDEPMYRAKVTFCRQQMQPLTGDDVKKFVKWLMPSGTPDFKREGGKKCYTDVDWQHLAENWNYEYKIGECDGC